MRKTGKLHHRAKLTDEQVKAMRYLRDAKGQSYRVIGREFGVSMWTVRDIVEYRTRA